MKPNNRMQTSCPNSDIVNLGYSTMLKTSKREKEIKETLLVRNIFSEERKEQIECENLFHELGEDGTEYYSKYLRLAQEHFKGLFNLVASFITKREKNYRNCKLLLHTSKKASCYYPSFFCRALFTTSTGPQFSFQALCFFVSFCTNEDTI